MSTKSGIFISSCTKQTQRHNRTLMARTS